MCKKKNNGTNKEEEVYYDYCKCLNVIVKQTFEFYSLIESKGERIMHDVVDVIKNMKKHIMAGVGYLIPVVVVGGIFCGLGVAFGGTTPWEEPGTLGYFFFTTGKVGLNLMPAVIGAFVALSIGDKAAVGPGLILGQVAQDCGAGFLGGLLAGIYVGIMVVLLKKINVPKNLNALMSIIIIPIVVTAIGAALLQSVIGGAITAFTNYLTVLVNDLGTGNLVLVALVFGFFATIDLGLFGSKALGPFVLALLAQTDPATGLPLMIGQRLNLTLVTACALPPLIVAAATIFLPKLWTDAEKQSGKAALFLGLCGITEGAIPLCLSHPKVYAGCIIGGMSGAVAQIVLGAGSMVNWPGLPNLPATTGVPQWFIAHGIGIATGLLFIALTMRKEEEKTEEKEMVVTQQGDEYNLDF